MGKLVVKFQGRLVNDVNLKLGDTKIGRGPANDIVLDDPIVSAEHAVIQTVGMKSTIQDLDSKNGTFVENRRVQRHELRQGETVIIGGYSLTYRDDVNLDAPAFGKKTAAAATPAIAHNTTTEIMGFAELVAVEGANKGKRLPLIKDAVMLDNPGKGPARISRTPDGYLLEAGVGPGEPRVNDKPVAPGGHLFESGDILDVAGTKYRFST